ncbi:type I-E CRISPR-associated protein Cse1/CasA [Streptomyces carpaticus]|uniref:type I-E CRISPR-associated protein Cse1/CasA n=1 Tax=Streptomyces carpaticus TaxID=285558 RepID=UPI0031F80F37
MSTYNLLDEPWIPVRWGANAGAPPPSDQPLRIGLKELLRRSQELAGLAVSEPPAHAALLRILYALTARVTGLDCAGATDWGERREMVQDAGCLPLDGIDEYVSRYHHRFFAFDPDGGRPWMQDARLATQCDPKKSAGVNKLIVTRPSGNNHAWFRHGTDASPDLPGVPEAVMNLLIWHYWGPSGRCSAREVNGVSSANTAAGPLRTALSYHPEGGSLFETLLAGLLPPSTSVNPDQDQCPWEWEDMPDPAGEPRLPTGPCSRWTACSQHALLLVQDEEDPELVRDAFITWAYRTGRIPRDDAYLIWQTSQQNHPYPRPADSRRALWRDLDALLLHHPVGSAQPKHPRVFDSAAEVSEDLRVRALGFEQDGQARDIQFVDASTPPVLGFVEAKSPHTAPAVATLRQLGERYGFRLRRAVKQAWAAYREDPKAKADTWVKEAEARYWPGAEEEFWARFRRLDQTGQVLNAGLDEAAARRAFLRIAEDAYDTVTRTVVRTQRGARAVADARLILRRPGQST